MSINALSPNRFTPQQARLNPQAAQQRQGVTFPKEATIEALERFGQIVRVVALDGATKYDYGLLYHVKQGLKALIGNQEDRFTGRVEVIPDLDKPHLSIMRVSLQRETPHLGEGAEPLTHRVELSPTSASDAVENDFKNALGFVRGTEREMFEAEILSKVPEKMRKEIRKDAEALFGDGASGDDFYPGLDFT